MRTREMYEYPKKTDKQHKKLHSFTQKPNIDVSMTVKNEVARLGNNLFDMRCMVDVICVKFLRPFFLADLFAEREKHSPNNYEFREGAEKRGRILMRWVRESS